jgi:formate hydrogenlyase subunit 6/NADH:ubiquinone oxidoreductase subunit I
MILEKKQLLDIIQSLSSGHEIIGPVKEEGGVYFRSVDSLEQIIWEFANAVNNIKDFFFPPRQELYEFRRDGIKTYEADPDSKRIILFPRACDTRALTLMDRLFMSESSRGMGDFPHYEDALYTQLRENTVIMGLSCLEPDERCFCLSLGGGPFHTEGMDASVTPLGNSRYTVQLITEKARRLFPVPCDAIAKAQTSILAVGDPTTEEDRERLEELKDRAESVIKRKITVPENMRESFDSGYWQEVSRSCIKCGICSYLCPTCHCFDIVDEGYLRVRCWDTCSSDTFTRMAAGEDHRREKYKRYRQRIFHKFVYYSDNFDAVACVGCGRCTTYCPVKIDIVEVVNNLSSRGMGDSPHEKSLYAGTDPR